MHARARHCRFGRAGHRRLATVTIAGALALAAAACGDEGHPPVATELGSAPIGAGPPVTADAAAEGRQPAADWSYYARDPRMRGGSGAGRSVTRGTGGPAEVIPTAPGTGGAAAGGTTGAGATQGATPGATQGATPGATQGGGAGATPGAPPAGGGGFGIGGGSGVGTGRGSGEGISGGAGLGAGGLGGGTGNIPGTPPGGLSGVGGTDVGTGREVGGTPGGAGLGSSGSGGQDYGTSGPSGEAARGIDPTPPGSIPNRSTPARDGSSPGGRIEIEFF